jgi:hydrogenase maturation protease
MASTDVLVLGVGNVLMTDEGVGVHVVRRFEAEGALPPAVRVVDGGTLGLDLLPMVADARALIVVDAVDMKEAPGTVRVLRGAELHGALGGQMSAHQIGLGDLLAVGRLTGELPDRLAVVGIQPGVVDVGLEPTAACAGAIPNAVAAVRAELDRLVSATVAA